MCELPVKLIAWLDRELPADEASAVERHVSECQECRCWAARYRQVSETFDAYCDAVMAAKSPRRTARWAPVLAGAMVIAAIIFLVFARPRLAQRPAVEATLAAASVRATSSPVTEPGPAKIIVHRRQGGARAIRVSQSGAQGQPMYTAIQIAIPAEAMFPPGAMPSGVDFIADLRISPDGAVKQVRLRQ